MKQVLNYSKLQSFFFNYNNKQVFLEDIVDTPSYQILVYCLVKSGDKIELRRFTDGTTITLKLYKSKDICAAYGDDDKDIILVTDLQSVYTTIKIGLNQFFYDLLFHCIDSMVSENADGPGLVGTAFIEKI